VDYDGDGDSDILGGSYTGELYLFQGSGKGVYAQGVRLADQSGVDIKIEYSVTPEVVDMDGDGDLDLVVGTRSGAVILVPNAGSRTQPVWSTERRELRTAAGQVIKGSNAHHADWDGDGVPDLIVGSEGGEVTWYRNIGKRQAPQYAAGQQLLAALPSEKLVDDAAPTHPGTRVKVHVADWNGDGRPDLLVGDALTSKRLGAALTEEEQRQKSELEPLYSNAVSTWVKLQQEQQEVRKQGEVPAELETRLQAAEEIYRELSQQMARFRKDKTLWHGFVWLYLRQPAAGG
jgi:hypothetical protein